MWRLWHEWDDQETLIFRTRKDAIKYFNTLDHIKEMFLNEVMDEGGFKQDGGPIANDCQPWDFYGDRGDHLAGVEEISLIEVD